ncbi:exopolygalacturonase-like [Amaranthus tricolor]|uniref:exopolygalacturonase-like n=1 Tax=Amaranthus tricolor TaxID=29722 RepID=UPI00258C8AA5|nr:exopolygalacturonase-like [Amaranthus tricolor]
MGSSNNLTRKKLFFVFGLVFFIHDLQTAKGAEQPIFDVTKFDAKGNGKPVYTEDGENANSFAFIQAWQKACNSIGPSKVVIPTGTFVVAQVLFSGPCQSEVTVELEGKITADPDPSVFPNQELIVFQLVEGAKLTGTGLIDVNQPLQPSDPNKDFVFMEVMPSIKFSNATNCVVDGIHSLNPSAFHVLVENSHNISIVNSNFDSTTIKPDTHSNAIYVSGSSLVAITNTQIKSGDDCITVSGGSADVSISGITCVAGKGISVGSQLDGFRPDYNVKGVIVKNCTFKGAAYGARINARQTDKPSEISNIVFEDLVMDQTLNPISIKQDYLPIPDKPNYAKITNIKFKNIKGTTTTNAVVAFACSKVTPCDGVEVSDINFSFTGKPSIIGKLPNLLSANCANAKVTFSGAHQGLNCA